MSLQRFPRQINGGLTRMGATLKAAGVVITYLLRDEFTTDEAAPIASPRTCEPGPGTLTATTSIFISGGKANLPVSSQRLVSQNIAASAGNVFAIDISHAASFRRVFLSISTQDTPTTEGTFDIDTNRIYYINRSPSFVPFVEIPAATIARIYTIWTGAFWLVCLKISGQIFLTWVSDVNDSRNNQPYRVFTVNNFAIVDNMTIANSQELTDYKLSTARITTPSAGDEIAHEADGFVHFTWTAVTGQVLEFDVRRTDADNRWIIRVDQAGGWKLIERNAGVETERVNQGIVSWTNGVSYTFQVILAGNRISAYAKQAATAQAMGAGGFLNYISATFNNTATIAKVDKAGANLVSWPRNLSGKALEVLELM